MFFLKFSKKWKKNAQLFINKGYLIKHVDLGGGLGVTYQQNKEVLKLELVKSEMDKCFKIMETKN